MQANSQKCPTKSSALPVVGLDLRPTEPGFKAHFGRGTGRYTAQLASYVAAQALIAKDLEIQGLDSTVIGPKAWESRLLGFLPLGRKTVEHQLMMPFRFKRSSADLLHFFAHPDAPVLCRQPYVVTVLDLIPLRFPDMYRADKPNWRFKFARYLENRAVQGASAVLAISEATKRDVVDLLGVEPERVFVTELAVDDRFSARPWQGDEFVDAKKVSRRRLSLPEDRQILLYVGGIDARKNVPFLMDVFAKLLSQVDESRKPLMVLAGSHVNDDKYEALCSHIKMLGISDSVVELGFVAEEDLLSLYHAADVFVFPSIYEGFGLPVLEAMASGVPVVAGNNSSIPEVCGSELPLMPDNQSDVWVEEIRALLDSDSLQRARCEKGRQRSQLFTWEATAIKTLDVYREVLSSSI